MNYATISAIAMALGVLIYGLILSASGAGLKMFYDFPSMFIVLGGVVAATAMSFQYKRMWQMMKAGLGRVLKGKSVNFPSVINEIILLVDSYRKGETLKSIADKAKDPFFKEGVELLNGGIMSPEAVSWGTSAATSTRARQRLILFISATEVRLVLHSNFHTEKLSPIFFPSLLLLLNWEAPPTK